STDMRLFQYIAIVIFCFSQLSLCGQDQQLITGNFTGYQFPSLVREIEKQTFWHIYYDSTETDSLEINFTANRISLQQVFDIVFKNTDLHYAWGTDNSVFVSKRYTIQTALPKNFFDPGKWGNDSTALSAFNPEDAIVPKSNLKISSENKVYDIGIRNGKNTSLRPTLAGYVRDAKTGEALMGASISVDTLSLTKTTDQFGYYSLTLPKGRHIIRISSVGMKDTRRQVIMYSDGKLNIDMDEFVASLKAVVVSADKTSNTRSVQMGVSKLNIQSIKQVPVVFGEADVLRVLLTLPGVTSVGEGSNGFNVRGGASDQNLILYNDATVYNPSHMFGFFSAFDPDLVKSVELYKSAIPEKYGGRLSSVLDVDVKDGNKKKWTGTAGISPLTSKFSIEGPLQKDKTSVIAGFRTTYSDWLLNQIPSSSYSNSTANFYDISLHLSHIINAKNTLYLMGYMSSDKFKLDGDTTYAYSNKNANIKWKHNFSNLSYAVFTTGIDHYQYSVASTKVPVNAYKLNFDINQIYLRADFNYSPGNKHSISYGLNSVYYQL
ncbi:MAG TPA: TonB-dependent receptor, partial [Puia sp.]|nr:TonB-dependent receptor [Puia sp.]